MSGATTNYGLVKPEDNEFYHINIPNGNMDIIDAQLKRLSDGLGRVPGEFAAALRGWKSGLMIETVDVTNIRIKPGSVHLKRENEDLIIVKEDATTLTTNTAPMWKLITINSTGLIQWHDGDASLLRPSSPFFTSGDDLLGYYYADGERIIGAITPTGTSQFHIINLGCHLDETGENQYGSWRRYTDGRLEVWGSLKITSITWTATGSLYQSQNINLLLPNLFIDNLLDVIPTITCHMITGSVVWMINSTVVAQYTPGEPIANLKIKLVAPSNNDSSQTHVHFVVRGHWR